MKPKISQTTVNAIRQELLERRKESPEWLAYTTELQNDATFLLIAVQMPPRLGDQRYKAACEQIRRIVADKIPPSRGEYSWMGVIKIEGEVVESVMPEMLPE